MVAYADLSSLKDPMGPRVVEVPASLMGEPPAGAEVRVWCGNCGLQYAARKPY